MDLHQSQGILQLFPKKISGIVPEVCCFCNVSLFSTAGDIIPRIFSSPSSALRAALSKPNTNITKKQLAGNSMSNRNHIFKISTIAVQSCEWKALEITSPVWWVNLRDTLNLIASWDRYYNTLFQVLCQFDGWLINACNDWLYASCLCGKPYKYQPEWSNNDQAPSNIWKLSLIDLPTTANYSLVETSDTEIAGEERCGRLSTASAAATIPSDGVGDIISRILSSPSSALLAAFIKPTMNTRKKQLPKPSKMNNNRHTPNTTSIILVFIFYIYYIYKGSIP